MSSPHRGPPSAQGSFARLGRYPLRRDVLHHVREHYLSFLAHTSPCVRPNPSGRLQFPWPTGLCRLSSVPAARWPFPVLSPQSLHRCLDPYPAAPLRCLCPFLPGELRSHLTKKKFDTPEDGRYATLTTQRFRGCSHSLMFRLPCSLDPLIAPTAGPHFPRAAGPFTPRNSRGVTRHGPWHHYVPESDNWHGGTFTRWTAALPAAPLCGRDRSSTRAP